MGATTVISGPVGTATRTGDYGDFLSPGSRVCASRDTLSANRQLLIALPDMCGVEVWRGGLGGTYRLPALSSAGASLAPPCFRFHTPLIEPDVRICRIRLSEKTHAIAVAIACDAVCNFWKQLGSCQACRQSPFLSPLLASAFN